MRLVWRGLLGLVFALALAAAVFVDLITHAAESDPVARGDAAVVLGAAVWGDGPSPVFQARIDHALDLYRAGHVRTLVFTGGTQADSVAAESEVARRYAIGLGTPPEAIREEVRSRTTLGNLRCSLPVIRALGADRIVLVSDPLHLWRARWMARDLGLDVEIAPTPTTRYRTRSARGRFLLREVVFSFVYAAQRLGPERSAC